VTFERLIFVSHNGGLVDVAGSADVSANACYFWKQLEDDNTRTALFSMESKGSLSITDSLLAGDSYAGTGGQLEVICTSTTIVCRQTPLIIGPGSGVSLRCDRNLFAGADKVVQFWPLSGQLTAAERAEVAQRLPAYQGVNNAFFECQRLAPQLSSGADTDLSAWQSFTNNGEKGPQFVDPQFARPDLMSQVQQKLFPPRTFALKPTSPLRQLKIGCDVSQLPDLPPRLYDLLPADMRPDVVP
jgi:hypothetical protein